MLNTRPLASLHYDQHLGFFDLFQQSQAGEEAAQVDNNSDVLGGLIADSADRLGPGVR